MFKKLEGRMNNFSNRTRLVLGLCIIAAGLIWGAWSFDLIGAKPDKETAPSIPVAEFENRWPV